MQAESKEFIKIPQSAEIWDDLHKIPYFFKKNPPVYPPADLSLRKA